MALRFGENDFDYYKVYVLALENSKFYVGITKEIERRIAEHKSGKGAYYTFQNKPINIVYKKNLKTKYKNHAEEVENSITIDLMKKYGISNVRGGDFCQLTDNEVRKALGKRCQEIEQAYLSGEFLNTF